MICIGVAVMSNEMCVQKRKAPITHHHLLFRYFYDFALFCATYRAISQRNFNRQLWVIFLAYSVLDNPALSFLAASHMSSSRYGTRRLLKQIDCVVSATNQHSRSGLDEYVPRPQQVKTQWSWRWTCWVACTMVAKGTIDFNGQLQLDNYNEFLCATNANFWFSLLCFGLAFTVFEARLVGHKVRSGWQYEKNAHFFSFANCDFTRAHIWNESTDPFQYS